MNKTITYSSFHRWYKEVIAQPEKLFSSKNAKRINSTLKRLESENITYKISELDEDFFDWFEPLYQKTILGKHNPQVHDIKSATLLNTTTESKYYSLTLLQDDIILGGIIFGVRQDRIMIAYKVFQNNWIRGTLQASPTLLAEHIICSHAYDLQKQFISHGKDRNPYGLNASIGLANYKLSVGYEAYIGTEDDYMPQEFILTTDKQDDILILHYPSSGDKITNASLFTNQENKDKYSQILSYPNQLNIELIIR